MMKNIIYGLWLGLGSCVAANVALAEETAQFERERERADSERLQQNRHFEALSVEADKPKTEWPPVADGKTVSLTREEALAHPDLLNQALASALLQNQLDKVLFLYPIYTKLPPQEQDALARKWADAVYERSQRRHTQAIRLYRELIAQSNQLFLIRFQLAQALFENKEFEAAEDQFRKLASERQVAENPQLAKVVGEYLQAVRNGQTWNFSGGVTYLQDKNINSAASDFDYTVDRRDAEGNIIGQAKVSSDKPESASGLNFNAGAERQWQWGNGWFHQFQSNVSGKYYWDNKRFNEVTGRVGAGVGYQNITDKVAVTPFVEQSWYAGGSKQSDTVRRFSRSAGVSVEASKWLNHQWQVSGNAEYARQRYQERKHLDGHSSLLSLTEFYLPNARQHWFAGADYLYNKTRDKENAYQRPSVRLGWGQEWGKGFSTRVVLSYGYRRYQAPNFWQSVQKNREFSANVSVWNRALHFWGITPRLTWQYQQTKSNQKFYTHDKNRLFIELNKQF
ncbi:surface lipoprotein assembly modifier [Neisseria sp. ZJ106]|uniref:Porin family protein n=1 Tax=Neisseria lisongii TaxID=2912188 RepID=A0ABY7RK09_9NEIS|nr:porin family protein [Neisseria lisongii]MCF7520641.1 surface lipoprotein assembly modifier [Neisseria lisongii]WCL71425.1 porin family protein [Neisseria lisongii]